MFSTDPGERPALLTTRSEVCSGCHADSPVRVRPPNDSRVRFSTSPHGATTLGMVTPIYNEPACSNAACHAHPAKIAVLGVLDLSLRLDPVEEQSRALTTQTAVQVAIVVVVGWLCILLFTHRFVANPIRELVRGTKAVSKMNLDRPIQITHRSAELDELVDSFNVMRERLKLAVEQSNELTQNLETKVAERTEQLRAAHQKLLHSDRLASLGQLSASVAHEINNPVSGVLNLSMLLQRLMGEGGIPPGREAEFRKYLGQISSETARVGRIVSDLLAFSRRSKPQRSPADLNKLVNTTVGLIRHKLKMIEAEAVLDLQPDLPSIECDPSQMQQVILNLVLNAAEAMQGKRGGKLTVRTRLCDHGELVELRVADTGEGIPPENIGKIFDPFFTSKPEGKGVGLGLAVLYGIVRAHDGEVEVESHVNEGTVFTVTLPLTSSAAPVSVGSQRHAP